MAYDVNGVYTLPSPEYPLVPNTLADAGDLNTMFADFQTAFGQVVLRSGVAAFTGPIKATDGSAAAPGLTFNSDTNTGLYRITADTLGVSTGGTLRLTVSPTQVVSTLPWVGNVTGDVTGNLTGNVAGNVTGSVTGAASLNVLKAGDTMTGDLINTAGIRVQATTAALQLWKDGTPTKAARLAFNTASTDGVSLGVFNGSTWNNALNIDANGNVGIGVAPATQFHVKGGSASLTLRLEDSTGVRSDIYSDQFGSMLINADSGNTGIASSMRFLVDNTERMRIDSSGNVGIGMTPARPLDITSGASSEVVRINGLNGGGAYLGLLSSGAHYGYVGAGSGLVTGGTLSQLAIRSQAEMLFAVSLTERMRIDSAGRLVVQNGPVGAGQTSAVKGLQLRFDPTNNVGYIDSTQSGVANYPLRIGGSAVQLDSGGSPRLLVDSSTSYTYPDSGSTALEIGFRGVPNVLAGGFITLGASHNGKCVIQNTVNGVQADTGLAAGTTISIINDTASAISLIQGSGMTLRLAGTTTTGSRTIAPRGVATVLYVATNGAYVSGAGVS